MAKALATNDASCGSVGMPRMMRRAAASKLEKTRVALRRGWPRMLRCEAASAVAQNARRGLRRAFCVGVATNGAS
ncbi:hypothetical protein L596_007901 [Steinernema carpocapsae]|uniref:Uncharacterized protein n=1 Tax=Steinernema carpocapsae TaxID=34508 RepID=A0A4U5PBT9_STECR|nr:hypothetical protein L596_007901 [Steinernema carpocapsae]